jgi:hypothetical protein
MYKANMELKQEFKNLIDALGTAKLLNTSDAQLLCSLEVKDYNDITEILRSQVDKATVLTLMRTIGKSRFVLHNFEWTNIISVITRLLELPDWQIRLEAALTLGDLDATDTLDALGKVAVFDENESVREIAIYAISHWRLPSSASYLIPIVLDPSQSASIRETAIEALGISEAVEALPVLGELLRDPSPDIKDFAVLALNNTQNPAAIPYLKTVLSDHSVSRFGKTIAEQAQSTIAYLTGRAAQLNEKYE